VGGRIAFGRHVDVKTWEYAIDRGEARFVTRTVPTGWGNAPLRTVSLADGVVSIARVRNASIEISHPEQTWQPGDEIILLSRLPDDELIAPFESSALAGV
jgi:hypothetical protein